MRASELLQRMAWLPAVVLMGAAGGAGVSKLMWNYWWQIPSICFPVGVMPQTLSLIRGGLVWNVASKEERDALLQGELNLCRTKARECTYGRALMHWEPQALLGLAGLDRASVSAMLETAEQLYPTALLPPWQSGIGVATSLSDGSALVAFQTYELHDDTHGMVEVWFEGGDSAVLRAADRYFFDIAGLEFLTPPVLLSGGGLVGLVFGSVVILLRRRLAPSVP